jgi:FkbM family methyltransferase
MFNCIKVILRRVLGARLISYINIQRQKAINKKGYLSYSQEGEDRVLSSLLFKINGAKHIENGFYIDVGAHDPYRFSNTFIFYKQGWNGINIDAMPGSMSMFYKIRPRDINLEMGVGKTRETLKFFVFNEPALNTFDERLAKARCNNMWFIKSVVDVEVAPLSEILKQHVRGNQKIDFITIDVEGLDFEVLTSNDWNVFRPKVVVVEIFGVSLEDLIDNSINKYLSSVGYNLYSKTVNTAFFVDKNLI